MRQSDKVIVSFASKGRENYCKAQLRMVKSCALIPWDGDYIVRSLDGDCDEYSGIPILLGKYPEGSTNNHSEIPYGFKVDIVKEAIDKGYKQIVWMDSTVLMAKNIQPMLDYAAENGVAAFDNLGHPLYKWISDYALQKLNIPENVLPLIPQIMACVLIFDVENVRGRRVFDRWYAASRDGVSFQGYGSDRPGFVAHRHDQAVLSGLLYQHNIPLLPYGRLVYHPHEETGEFGTDIFFINKGI